MRAALLFSQQQVTTYKYMNQSDVEASVRTDSWILCINRLKTHNYTESRRKVP